LRISITEKVRIQIGSVNPSKKEKIVKKEQEK
jgi:hypothetical protein